MLISSVKKKKKEYSNSGHHFSRTPARYQALHGNNWWAETPALGLREAESSKVCCVLILS